MDPLSDPWPLAHTAMLPSLSKLNPGDVCPPCTPAPTSAELDAWDERAEELTAEELARIPPTVNETRAECSICFEELRDEVEGSAAVIVAVDIDGACGHAFHKTCLKRWFDQQVRWAGTLSCPLCKQPFLDRKIDALYQRVNGRRPPPQPRPPRAQPRPPRAQQPQRVPRNAIARYPTLWEDALPDAGPNDGTNWRLIFTAIPDRVEIRIPDRRRADWTEYTREVFCNRYEIDPARLTREVWTNILTQPSNRQNWWLNYHQLVSNLRTIATDAPRAAVAGANAVSESIRSLARDVNQARAEGASWSEIMRAIVLGDD